jgi:hypothetical protein
MNRIRYLWFVLISVMAIMSFSGCVSSPASNSAPITESAYEPDFYQDVQTPFEGKWNGTWHDINGNRAQCRFVFRGNTFVWYVKGKLFARGESQEADGKLSLIAKELKPATGIAGVIGAASWAAQNNVRSVTFNFEYSFPGGTDLYLKAGNEYAEMAKE